MTGAIPAIMKLIEMNSGRKLLRTFCQCAALHRFHEQRLEDEQAEGEAGEIFDDEVEPHRQAECRRDDGGENDARSIAGNAVDGRADALLPQRSGEILVLARQRLLVSLLAST